MKTKGFQEQIPRTIARARPEDALRKSELRYRRLFETAQDGILILDAETGGYYGCESVPARSPGLPI